MSFERTEVALPMDPAVAAAMRDADLGLVRGVVGLSDPSPKWATAFAELTAAMEPTRPPEAIDIQHVGSTSVPGLVAKPILDVALAVAGPSEAIAVDTWLRGLGFFCRGARDKREPEVLYGLELEQNIRLINLHVERLDGDAWRHHLALRDELRANDAVREAYGALKRGLAVEFPDDRLAYIDGKSEFILAHREWGSVGDSGFGRTHPPMRSSRGPDLLR